MGPGPRTALWGGGGALGVGHIGGQPPSGDLWKGGGGVASVYGKGAQWQHNNIRIGWGVVQLVDTPPPPAVAVGCRRGGCGTGRRHNTIYRGVVGWGIRRMPCVDAAVMEGPYCPGPGIVPAAETKGAVFFVGSLKRRSFTAAAPKGDDGATHKAVLVGGCWPGMPLMSRRATGSQ